jgi:hypothetical protein
VVVEGKGDKMQNKKAKHDDESRQAVPMIGTTMAHPDRGLAGSTKKDPSPEKKSGGAPFPGNDWAVRKSAPSARRYWPSANSQHAPSRPPGNKKASR